MQTQSENVCAEEFKILSHQFNIYVQFAGGILEDLFFAFPKAGSHLVSIQT